MSKDAKAWKKKRLKDAGVNVVEHAGDYSLAVAKGRTESDANPCSYFVDDENSPRLFVGYAVAALRLQKQLQEAGIEPTLENPLFVYLPCGVGGAPGGVCFGLKQVYGNRVHCFFAEPVQAPCMIYALLEGNNLPVSDLGLTIDTDADGLAVGCASEAVAELMDSQLAGCFTVSDSQLYRDLYKLHETESLDIEPSAAAGFQGPTWLLNSEQGNDFLRQQGLTRQSGYHLLWTTGGLFVPEDIQKVFVEKGRQLDKLSDKDA